jgi:hypothetical protein
MKPRRVQMFLAANRVAAVVKGCRCGGPWAGEVSQWVKEKVVYDAAGVVNEGLEDFSPKPQQQLFFALTNAQNTHAATIA